MNTVCPFDLQLVNTNVLLTYLLSIKRKNNTFFDFNGKHSAFMHPISQSGNTQDDNEKEAMANMMKALKKTIAKEMSERGLRVVEGKEHMSFKYYQKKCQLLIEEGSPDLVFAFCVIDNAMEHHFLF